MNSEKRLIDYAFPFTIIYVVISLIWAFNVSMDIAHLKRMDSSALNRFDTLNKSTERITSNIEKIEKENLLQKIEAKLLDPTIPEWKKDWFREMKEVWYEGK